MRNSLKQLEEMLSVRAKGVLRSIGVADVESFMKLSNEELLAVRNCGTKTVKEIKRLQATIQKQEFTTELGIQANKQKFGTENFRDLLSVRANRVVESLGVSNLDSFLALSAGELFRCRNCGRTTVFEIEGLQKELVSHLEGGDEHSKSSNTATTSPCDFGKVLEQIPDSENRLFKAVVGSLSKRAKNVVSNSGVDSLSEFVKLEKDLLFKTKNCGRKTVEEIHAIQTGLISHVNSLLSTSEPLTAGKILLAPCFLSANEPGSTEDISEDLLVDVENPFPWLSKWIRSFTHSDKQAKVFMLRKGMLGAEPATLEQAGMECELTRERARQIEVSIEKKASSQTQQARLMPLIEKAESIVEQLGGMVSVEELAERLFNVGQDGEYLAKATRLLEFFLKLKISKSRNLRVSKGSVIKSNLMPDLKAFSRKIEELAPTTADEWYNNELWSVGLRAFKDAFIQYIQKDQELGVVNVSDALFFHAIGKCKFTMKIHKYRLYSRGLWKLKHGRSIDAVEEVLLSIGKHAHYSEITKLLRKWRPDIKERNVHAGLDRSEKALLWDRGTFIHKENAIVPLSLIHDVEEWLIKILQDDIPFVSAYGAYRHFEKRCNQVGMFAELALYTCLKQIKNPKLVFPKTPYIYLRETFTEYMPTSVALENVLLETGGAKTIKELRRFALDKMFLKPFQFEQAIYGMPNAIHVTRNRIAHIDNISIDQDAIDKMISYAVNLLQIEEHFSVEKLFNEKQVTCLAYGINCSDMLYSLLQHYNDGSLGLERYPRIERPSASDTETGHGIQELIVEYIRKANSPCPYEKLEEVFVKNLGYQEQYVYHVANHEDLFFYHTGCLIHKDTVEWGDFKQNELEGLANQHYKVAREAGRYFGRISHLAESPKLPKLPSGLYWSPFMISDLLKKSGKYRFLGNTREAFVPISHNGSLCSFEDLVYLMLKDKWDGAANLAEFQEMLAKERIIKRHLTPTMLGDNGKVVIRDREIILKELLVYAD